MGLTIKHRTIKNISISSIFQVDYKDHDSTTEQVKVKPLLSEKTKFTFHKSVKSPIALGIISSFTDSVHTVHTYACYTVFTYRCSLSNPIISFFEEYSDLDQYVSQSSEKNPKVKRTGICQHDSLKGIRGSSEKDKYQLYFKSFRYSKVINWDESFRYILYK